MISAAPISEQMSVRVFETGGGARIFRIPLREFPILLGYVYLVLVDGAPQGQYRVLIDTGSGYADSNRDLEEGLAAVSGLVGEEINLSCLTHVLITHGHIDHFGGLPYIRSRTSARVGVHELDVRNLTHHEERLAVVSRRLRNYLQEAGVGAQKLNSMIEMYRLTKSFYTSVPVDFTFDAAGMRLGPFEMLHVPGHCAGHVVIRLHDVLFAGDHVLDDISPHQSPEHLTLFTGLDHYLKSLDALQAWAGEARLTLAGHGQAIEDLPRRMDAIQELHRQRLDKVLDLLQQPLTVAEISHQLFGEVSGYNVLLAVEEAGAHVEYLYQRGLLGIANLADLEDGREPVAIRYQRLQV
jgi:glyoxylase-like metal-dependent hydrolase (beta-lactamase superfamily II)